jgi:hypothetical protein
MEMGATRDPLRINFGAGRITNDTICCKRDTKWMIAPQACYMIQIAAFMIRSVLQVMEFDCIFASGLRDFYRMVCGFHTKPESGSYF